MHRERVSASGGKCNMQGFVEHALFDYDIEFTEDE